MAGSTAGGSHPEAVRPAPGSVPPLQTHAQDGPQDDASDANAPRPAVYCAPLPFHKGWLAEGSRT